ncbi:hypothetical protein [uncultured Methylobacterium sp.]|jgi:hypothetical protein|uniref:hypothetical protein n=1 Tax=uncultured Methylobacterium sp. TaxID=157278 RepID=UPI00262275A1|nr:hypothetical protein [uncultured Methylobacterium sp.]
MRNTPLLLVLAGLTAAPAAALDPPRPGDPTGRDAALRSLSVAGPAATPWLIEAGACDLARWGRDPGGTQSPIPACFGTKIADAITIPYPGVVGIGDEGGRAVPAGDPTHFQRGQVVVQARTALDNRRQESAIASNLVVETGGGGLPQTNHNQKVNLTLFTLVRPGASNSWGLNNDFHLHAGVGNYPGYRHEGDMTNFNCDYRPNGPCGVAAGDFLTYTGKPVTAGTLVTGNPEPNGKSLYYGVLFQGVAGFEGVGTGLISDVTIWDGTNARVSYNVTGRHDVGFKTLDGTMPYAIQTRAGQKTCLGGAAGCLVYEDEGRRLAYGEGIRLHDDGGLVAASVTEPRPSTPPRASSPCTVGQHAWDAEYEYRCVAPNRWKRAALSSW